MFNKIFKKDELKFLWPFYLSNFLLGLSLIILPFLVIYFKNMGFSLYQISLFTSAMAIGVLLFEIPTGAFADNYSRKKSIVLGFFIYGILLLGIAFITDFYVLLCFWFLSGLAVTFISGADDALVIDNLSHLKREDLKKEFFIKVQALRGFGMIISPFIGAYVVKNYSMSLVWVISGISIILVGAIFTFMKEYYVPKRKSFVKSVMDSYKTSSKGLKFIINNKKLLILIAAGLFFSLMSAANNGWQPLLVEFSLPEYSLGIVYSILGIFTIISSIISRYLTTKIKILLPIFIVMKMILAFGLLLVTPPEFLGVVMIFIVYTGMLDAITMPSLSVYFHKISKKKIRATLVSIKSMVSAFVIAIFSIFAGLLMDNIGITRTIILSSLFGIIAIFFFLRVKD